MISIVSNKIFFVFCAALKIKRVLCYLLRTARHQEMGLASECLIRPSPWRPNLLAFSAFYLRAVLMKLLPQHHETHQALVWSVHLDLDFYYYEETL